MMAKPCKKCGSFDRYKSGRCRPCAQTYKRSEKGKSSEKRYLQNNPWMKSLIPARRRCNDPNFDSYPSYGGRGIKFLLTPKQGRELWVRDGAYLMDNPSIDRIDPSKDYAFDNCRFIELTHNIKRKKYKNRKT